MTTHSVYTISQLVLAMFSLLNVPDLAIVLNRLCFCGYQDWIRMKSTGNIGQAMSIQFYRYVSNI